MLTHIVSGAQFLGQIVLCGFRDSVGSPVFRTDSVGSPVSGSDSVGSQVLGTESVTSSVPGKDSAEKAERHQEESKMS